MLTTTQFVNVCTCCEKLTEPHPLDPSVSYCCTVGFMEPIVDGNTLRFNDAYFGQQDRDMPAECEIEFEAEDVRDAVINENCGNSYFWHFNPGAYKALQAIKSGKLWVTDAMRQAAALYAEQAYDERIAAV